MIVSDARLPQGGTEGSNPSLVAFVISHVPRSRRSTDALYPFGWYSSSNPKRPLKMLRWSAPRPECTGDCRRRDCRRCRSRPASVPASNRSVCLRPQWRRRPPNIGAYPSSKSALCEPSHRLVGQSGVWWQRSAEQPGAALRRLRPRRTGRS